MLEVVSYVSCHVLFKNPATLMWLKASNSIVILRAKILLFPSFFYMDMINGFDLKQTVFGENIVF